jgi:hypothetical protein
MLRRYVRVRTDRTVVPRGLVAVELDGDILKFGYSACNPVDTFTYKMANQIAKSRIDSGKFTCNINDPAGVVNVLTSISLEKMELSPYVLALATDIYYRKNRGLPI